MNKLRTNGIETQERKNHRTLQAFNINWNNDIKNKKESLDNQMIIYILGLSSCK